MKVLLDGLLPRVVPDLSFQCISHQGKNDLEKSIPRKLRAWREPGVRFVILRDNDGAHCVGLKELLLKICRDAGREDTLVRIVCEELEAWYLETPTPWLKHSKMRSWPESVRRQSSVDLIPYSSLPMPSSNLSRSSKRSAGQGRWLVSYRGKETDHQVFRPSCPGSTGCPPDGVPTLNPRVPILGVFRLRMSPNVTPFEVLPPSGNIVLQHG